MFERMQKLTKNIMIEKKIVIVKKGKTTKNIK